MNVSDFDLDVRGPAADLDALEALLRAIPTKAIDAETLVVELSAALPELVAETEEEGRRFFFARPDKWLKRSDGRLTIRGWMGWTPPLELMEVLNVRHPSCRVTCLSCTEHEWFECWRVEMGKCVCVEDLIVDLCRDVATKHQLREGYETAWPSLVCDTAKTLRRAEPTVLEGTAEGTAAERRRLARLLRSVTLGLPLPPRAAVPLQRAVNCWAQGRPRWRDVYLDSPRAPWMATFEILQEGPTLRFRGSTTHPSPDLCLRHVARAVPGLKIVVGQQTLHRVTGYLLRRTDAFRGESTKRLSRSKEKAPPDGTGPATAEGAG